ncbi:hypothetical protein MBLNU459_g5767t1 [Dothideomycetes sp. NU459]
MPVAPGPSKRFVILLIAVSFFLAFTFVAKFRSQPQGVRHPNARIPGAIPAAHVDIHPSTLTGPVIAPKLGNETAKAELGRAAWKLFHTTFARFPDKPTADESVALQAYIHLFQRLYPCGECAGHFGTILDKYPPQVSSRSAAAAWGCHVHNEVNKSLNKPIFDCSNIGDFYDCGCAEDETPKPSEKPEMSAERKEKLTGTIGRDFDEDLLTGDTPLKLEQEE